MMMTRLFTIDQAKRESAADQRASLIRQLRDMTGLEPYTSRTIARLQHEIEILKHGADEEAHWILQRDLPPI